MRGVPRKVVRRASRPAEPRALERAYTRELVAFSRSCSALVRKALGGYTLSRVRLDAAGPTGIDFLTLRARIGRLADSRAAELVARFGPRLATFSTAQIAQVLEIDITDQPGPVLRALAAWRRENVDLITSIPDRLLDDVEDVVTEAVERGTRNEVLAARLRERYDVSDSRAELIARDQINKANAQIQQAQMGLAGVTRYVWSTSRDERVRPMHKDLEGQTFAFDDPPVTNEAGDHNNPGGDFQCRCVAIPVME